MPQNEPWKGGLVPLLPPLSGVSGEALQAGRPLETWVPRGIVSLLLEVPGGLSAGRATCGLSCSCSTWIIWWTARACSYMGREDFYSDNRFGV